MKRCSKCGEEKPLSEFYKRKDRENGVITVCNACRATHNRQYRERNREKETERNRQYRERNREKMAEQHRQYRERNREKVVERNRQYRERNRERNRLAHYKNGAKKRGLEWSLSDEYAFELFSEPCCWCGGRGGGIDRMDNTKGYTIENSQPCCSTCNYMKHKLSAEIFIAQAVKITWHTVDVVTPVIEKYRRLNDRS